jgi:hypothetical protein
MGGWQRKKTYDWDIPKSPLETPAKFQRHGTDEFKAGVALRFTF